MNKDACFCVVFVEAHGAVLVALSEDEGGQHRGGEPAAGSVQSPAQLEDVQATRRVTVELLEDSLPGSNIVPGSFGV